MNDCLSLRIQLKQNGSHIVHSSWLFLGLGDKLIQQHFQSLLHGVLLEPVIDPTLHVLTGLNLPDAITAHKDIVNIPSKDLFYLRVSCDYLILDLLVFVPLIWEVAQPSRNHQVSIYTPLLDPSACLLYPLQLLAITRAMILTQFL